MDTTKANDNYARDHQSGQRPKTQHRPIVESFAGDDSNEFDSDEFTTTSEDSSTETDGGVETLNVGESAAHTARNANESQTTSAKDGYVPLYFYRDVLSAVYAAFAPHKLCNVRALLAEWQGQEDKMLEILRTKYNVSLQQQDQLLRQYRSLQRNNNKRMEFPGQYSTPSPTRATPHEVKGHLQKPTSGARTPSITGFICPACHENFGKLDDLMQHVPSCAQVGETIVKRTGPTRPPQQRARTAPNTPTRQFKHPLVSPPLHQHVAQKKMVKSYQKMQSQVCAPASSSRDDVRIAFACHEFSTAVDGPWSRLQKQTKSVLFRCILVFCSWPRKKSVD